MRFYRYDRNELQKELDSDFVSGLNEQKVKKHSAECSNKNSVLDFSIGKLSFSFVRASIFAILCVIVFTLLAIFKKDLSELTYALGFIIVALISAVLFYLVVFLVNRQIEQCDNFYNYTVLRSGKKIKLRCYDILYGDVVFLKKGDYVPFDAYVIESNSLIVDEQNVTNRKTVEKHPGVILKENVSPEELFNIVFSGSYVSSGVAKVVVTDVGERVYISKSHKQKHFDNKNSLKFLQIANLLMLVLLSILSISALIISIITKNIFEGIICILIFCALFFSDYISKYSLLSLSKLFAKLSNEKIYIKKLDVLEKINNSNAIIFDSNVLFDNKSTLTSLFYQDEFYSSYEISNNRLSPLIYSLLAGYGKLFKSYDAATVEILKKANVDFSEIDSLSPIVSYHSDLSSSVEICGRVYNDNNLIIAKGNYKSILKMCDCTIDDELLSKLYNDSTEIIAIATKKVYLIQDDLSVDDNGYKLLALLAFKNNISSSTVKKIKELNDLGYKCCFLYSGDLPCAKGIAKQIDSNVVSCDEFKLTRDLNTVAYNYNGDVKKIIDKIVEQKLSPVCCANSRIIDSRIASVDSFNSDQYNQSLHDIVCESDIKNYHSLFKNIFDTFSFIGSAFWSILQFAIVFIFSGFLFSLITSKLLFTPLTLLLAFTIIIPANTLIRLFINNNDNSTRISVISDISTYKRALIKVLSIAILITIALLIFISFCNVECIVGLVVIMLSVILVNIDYSKFKWIDLLLYVPTIFICILFFTPISVIFGVSGMTFFNSFLAILIGVFIQFIVNLVFKYIKL